MRGKTLDKVCLEKIIMYSDKITEICKKHNFRKADFEDDSEFQYACSLCIIQIGEYVTRLSDSIKNDHPEIPWAAIKAMRNIFAHDYDIVNTDTLWATITEDIPALKQQISKLLVE